MDIRVIPTGFEYDKVISRGCSLNVFEYVENAHALAKKVGGEVVEVYSTYLVNLVFADVDEDCEFDGFGVLTHDDWGDPVLL